MQDLDQCLMEPPWPLGLVASIIANEYIDIDVYIYTHTHTHASHFEVSLRYMMS